MKDAKYFVGREIILLAAIDRAKTLRDEYMKLLPDWPYSWDFNLLHDLVLRLENRFWDNWSDYHNWHWDEYGFNGYSC